MGELEITTDQADRLAVAAHRQLSPHLENCCLRGSANVSYEQAAQDVTYLTGMCVPAKTQQRVVNCEYRHGPVPKIDDLAAFETFANEHGHLSQQEMADQWPTPVSRVTIAHALRKIGFTRKKNVSLSRA